MTPKPTIFFKNYAGFSGFDAQSHLNRQPSSQSQPSQHRRNGGCAAGNTKFRLVDGIRPRALGLPHVVVAGCPIRFVRPDASPDSQASLCKCFRIEIATFSQGTLASFSVV